MLWRGVRRDHAVLLAIDLASYLEFLLCWHCLGAAGRASSSGIFTLLAKNPGHVLDLGCSHRNNDRRGVIASSSSTPPNKNRCISSAIVIVRIPAQTNWP